MNLFKMNIVIYSLLILLISCSEEHGAPVSMDEASFGSQTPEPKVSKIWPFISDASGQNVSPKLLIDNIYIVFDGSGSMGDRGCSSGQPKINVAREAFKEFLKEVPTQFNVGLHVFDGRGNHERVKLGINNRDSLINAVETIVPRSGTPLGPAIESAYQQITSQAQFQLGYGQYHVVIITDGIANSGHEPDGIVSKILSESPVMVHTIGFCVDETHALNQPGKTIYKTATDKRSLTEGLQGVLAEAPEYSVDAFN